MIRFASLLLSIFLLFSPTVVFGFDLALHRGYNVVGIPSGTNAPASVAELATQLGGSGAVESISRYDTASGTFQKAYYDGTVLVGDTFAIGPTEGYALQMKTDAALSYEADLQCAGGRTLSAGLNLAAFACSGGQLSAFDLLYDLGGPAMVSAVQRFNRTTGQIETAAFFNEQPVGTDFALAAGEGVFIHMLQPLNDWTPLLDTDADGVPDAADCAPADTAVYPGASEICGDDIDNDCSGVIDDRDADQDGFISADCGGSDVDDANPLVNPQMGENCIDGIDNDSDGLVDGADPTCGPGCDKDGDGHAAVECGGSDFNDEDQSVYPGAVETCGDGIDNDLDGTVDENCAAAGLFLTPDSANMLAGDSRLFLLIEETPSDTVWQFSVDDVVGGNDSVGTIAAASDPSRAVYQAPSGIASPITVTLRAADPSAPANTASATVTVYPLTGDYVVTPTSATVGLKSTQQFQAGMNVDLVGFIPLNKVYWKVNGIYEGSTVGGGIDDTGLYQAPAKMPPSLPYPIEVGFSFTKEGPVAAAVPLTLAELSVTPGTAWSITPAQVGTATAMLRYSDNTTLDPVPLQELFFSSDLPKVGNVDGATGAIIVGEETGRARVSVFHRPTLARTSLQLFSYSDVALKGEVVRRSKDFANIVREDATGTSLIEFTRPGAMFNFVPEATWVRGRGAGDSVAGTSENVTFSGDASVMVYDEGDQFPFTGKTAFIERKSGLVTLGDVPGTATVTATFDNGIVSHQVSLQVVFTRVQISVTALGNRSQVEGSAYITELIDVEVTVDNSNEPGTGFVGQTPIRITLEDDTDFEMMYGLDMMSGTGTAFTSNLYTGSALSPTEFMMSAASVADPTAPWPPNVIRFRISPKKPGVNSFKVAVANDPGVDPVVKQVTVLRPHLLPGTNLQTDSPIVKNSWVKIIDAPDDPYGVSIMDLYKSDSPYGFSHNDAPFWHITEPGGAQTAVPVTDLNNGYFTFTPTQAGTYTIYMGSADRPEFRTDDLALHVVEPSAVGSAPVSNATPTLTRSQMLGSFQIVGPVGLPWRKGQTTTIQIRTVRADGAIGSVGTTTKNENNEITQHQVLGVSVGQISGPGCTVGGILYPVEGSGTIFLEITPTTDTPAQDLILSLQPHLFFLSPDEYSGVLSEDHGVAVFSDPKDDSFLQPYIRLGGRGLMVEPRQLPVAADRLRGYVDDGILGSHMLDVDFTVVGTEGFDASLASGLDEIDTDLGPGITLKETYVVDGKLHVTVNIDAAATLGPRTIELAFNDGRSYQAVVELVSLFIDVGHGHPNMDLPLNASFHATHPVGSQVYRIRPEAMEDPSRVVQNLQLELIPSINAGDWVNGIQAPNPIVGFRRIIEPMTGAIRVSEDKVDLMQYHNAYFAVYGDVTDRGRLTDRGNIRISDGPDYLPDIVSENLGDEQLYAKIKGNYVDALLFTAYNIVARVQEDLPDPHLKFEGPLRDDIGTAYSKYAGVPSGAYISKIIADPGHSASVKVDVDREANFLDLDDGDDRIRNYLPGDYFAGILDQYYLFEYNRGDTYPIARDGRVHPFDGEREVIEEGSITGRDRKTFGIELDGVLYDPGIGNDKAPNSDDILALPVLADAFGSLPVQRNPANDLLKDLGGTSGGWFDLDREVPGSHFVLARTPASDLPGIHGGFLIDGKPSDLNDDDFSDVVLKRNPIPDNPKTPPIEESTRRVLAFGRNSDKKDPIHTALRANFKFKIATDPAGVTAIDGGPIPAKAALLVRERPLAPADSVNLLVTTQSDGSEGIVKALYDATVNLTVDICAGVLLNVVTGGGGSALCGSEISRDLIGDVFTASINAGIDIAKSEMLEPNGFDSGRITLANGLYNDGVPINPWLPRQQVSYRDLVVNNLSDEEAKKGVFFTSKMKIENLKTIGICSMLSAPFNALKDELKDAVSVEDLGGKGSAEAYGMKTMAVGVPSAQPESEDPAKRLPVHIHFSISRRIDIHPEEQYFGELSDFSYFNTGAEVKSDFDLIQEAIGYKDSDTFGGEAKSLLKRIAVQSVHREPVNHTDVYEDYRVRYSRLPALEGILIPGAMVADNQYVPDFELQVGETELPFSAASLVSVSRSNQNASARAAIHSDGFEMALIKLVIPEIQETP